MIWDTFQDILWKSLNTTIASIALIAGLIIAKRLEALMSRIRNKVTHIPFEKQLQFDHEVEAILNRCLQHLGADRVFISKIHNGEYSFTSDLGLLKKTRLYEVLGPGIGDEITNYQSIPISRMTEEMELVKEAGPSWKLTKDIVDSKFKRMLQLAGVHAVARCMMRREGRVVGFIGCDFVRVTEKPEYIDKLCDYAGQIEQIIQRMYDEAREAQEKE